MRKTEPMKYPHSANLFKFCKEVLSHEKERQRVIDQDVGQIIGYDAADCSHWKNGKKNIRSIEDLNKISKALNIESEILNSIIQGESSEKEALFELYGYNKLRANEKLLERSKKDFCHNNSETWSIEKDLEYKKVFLVNRKMVLKCVSEIHEKINFLEAPLYLPELMISYPKIRFKSTENNGVIRSYLDNDRFIIESPKKLESTPQNRFKIGCHLAQHFLSSQREEYKCQYGEYINHIEEVENYLFSSKLLAPSNLIKKELRSPQKSSDLIRLLAEKFWVSKSFMNHRLHDLILHND